MRIFVKSHESTWLGQSAIPMTITLRRLQRMRGPVVARGQWIIESSAETIIAEHGRHLMSFHEYVRDVQWYSRAIGGMLFAGIQDYPCDVASMQRTGFRVEDHQELTLNSYLACRRLAPEIPWMPVLVGVTPIDYLKHMDMYQMARIDVTDMDRVGVRGAFCVEAVEAVEIFETLRKARVCIHAMRIDRVPMNVIAPYVVSGDSMGYTSEAAVSPPMQGCNHSRCTHCLRYAEAWYQRQCGLIRMGLAEVAK